MADGSKNVGVGTTSIDWPGPTNFFQVPSAMKAGVRGNATAGTGTGAFGSSTAAASAPTSAVPPRDRSTRRRSSSKPIAMITATQGVMPIAMRTGSAESKSGSLSSSAHRPGTPVGGLRKVSSGPSDSTANMRPVMAAARTTTFFPMNTTMITVASSNTQPKFALSSGAVRGIGLAAEYWMVSELLAKLKMLSTSARTAA